MRSTPQHYVRNAANIIVLVCACGFITFDSNDFAKHVAESEIRQCNAPQS